MKSKKNKFKEIGSVVDQKDMVNQEITYIAISFIFLLHFSKDLFVFIGILINSYLVEP